MVRALRKALLPTYTVLGVDPGIRNTGLCLLRAGRYDTDVFLAPPVFLAYGCPVLVSCKKNATISARLSLLGDFVKGMFSDYGPPNVVVIERQYGLRQSCVAHFVQGLCTARDIPVVFRSPNTLHARSSRLMALHSLTRDSMSKRLKLRRSQSKWQSTHVMDSLYPGRVPRLVKRDDIADAFIYAYDTLLGNVYNINSETPHTIASQSAAQSV